MKKFIFSIACMLMFITVFLPVSGSAMGLSVGASTWYTEWNDYEDGSKSSDIDSFFLYGPLLSLKLNNDFSLSTLFLYGKTEVTFPFDDENLSPAYTLDSTRIDSDTGISYRLNSVFKVVAGFKYMWYKTEGGVYASSVDVYDTETNFTTYGPAFGINGTFSLGNSFYLNASISGMYLWWKTTTEAEGISLDDEKYNAVGINTGLSLLYYISAASVTLSLGGRYQIISDEIGEDGYLWDNRGEFYGITLSAIYSFQI